MEFSSHRNRNVTQINGFFFFDWVLAITLINSHQATINNMATKNTSVRVNRLDSAVVSRFAQTNRNEEKNTYFLFGTLFLLGENPFGSKFPSAKRWEWIQFPPLEFQLHGLPLAAEHHDVAARCWQRKMKFILRRFALVNYNPDA